MPGDAEQRFAAIARETGIWLLPGSFTKRRRAHLQHNAGDQSRWQVIARYRKMYPFLPYERGVAAGAQSVVFDVPGAGGSASPFVTMWFPETTRTLALDGRGRDLAPGHDQHDRSATSSFRWRAQAATNQCYVFDVNVAGRQLWALMIVGPGGG